MPCYYQSHLSKQWLPERTLAYIKAVVAIPYILHFQLLLLMNKLVLGSQWCLTFVFLNLFTLVAFHICCIYASNSGVRLLESMGKKLIK